MAVSERCNGHPCGGPPRAWILVRRCGIAAALVAATVLGAVTASGEQTTLNIATWGGAYGQSQEVAYFEPFAKETGTKIAMVIYDGSLAKLKELIDGGSPPVDLVDVSAGALGSLCSDGLLEPIETSALEAGPGGTSAEEDFFATALSACGVASVAWSTVIAFDRKALGGTPPGQVADLLDTKKFPGKRALPRGPRYTLELALLADGVAAENVYTELSTPAGVDRAFAALDKIKGEVLWWDSAQEPVAWLLENKAVMAAGYSGRIFRAAVTDRRLDILWDGQIYDLDLWAIPKGAGNKAVAKQFITFATEPERLAAQAQLIAYGPMRKSAVAMVGKHPVIGVDMKDFLPTAPDNFKNALRFDEAWWSEHGEALGKRFAAWHAKVQAELNAKDSEQKAKETTDSPPTAAP